LIEKSEDLFREFKE